MLEIIAILCLIGALVLLFFLSLIDLREGLLPNELVLGLLCLGVVFHLCTLYAFVSFSEMALGAFIGSGILYFIRTLASLYYGDDALGLGDVKLLGAAGVWLGPYYVLVGMTAGAIIGVFHGLGVALLLWGQTKKMPNLNNLSLPAGPGFAGGIVVAGVYAFWTFPSLVLP